MQRAPHRSIRSSAESVNCRVRFIASNDGGHLKQFTEDKTRTITRIECGRVNARGNDSLPLIFESACHNVGELSGIVLIKAMPYPS